MQSRTAVARHRAVLALMAVGAALRLTMLGQSVFADELATYWIVSARSLSGVFSIVQPTPRSPRRCRSRSRG